MAAGEYVSVSSQSDIERADVAREKQAIESDPDVEYAELVAIYQHRGLSHDPTKLVAKELTHHDALAAHVRACPAAALLEPALTGIRPREAETLSGYERPGRTRC